MAFPRQFRVTIVALSLVLAQTFLLTPSSALAATWVAGDLFLGVESGSYQVRDSATGTLKETLTTSSSYTTGCALDAAGNFYGTWLGTSEVFKFDATTHAPVAFGSGYSTPESILFDAAGNVFVGNLGNGLREYTSTGTFIKTVTTNRIDWFDIAADQDTVLYTQEGNSILRVSISTGAALPNFTTATASDAFALRILADGGVLLANGPNVLRYNSSGVVVQTYDVIGEDTWFSLNLDPNGTSFWAGNYGSSNVYRFNIATGAVEKGPYNTGTGSSTLFGICLKGEITAAKPDTTKPLCSILQILGGPPKQIQIQAQDTESGIATIQVTSQTNVSVAVPSFTAGTTANLVVTATKVDQSKAASVQLTVTDVAGNVTVCDPVMTTLVREKGQPSAQTFKNLPQKESKLTIVNGNPGLDELVLVVNGTKFKVDNLNSGVTSKVDVAKAMHPGNNNTIEIRAKGDRGATADLLISD